MSHFLFDCHYNQYASIYAPVSWTQSSSNKSQKPGADTAGSKPFILSESGHDQARLTIKSAIKYTSIESISAEQGNKRSQKLSASCKHVFKSSGLTNGKYEAKRQQFAISSS